MAKAKLRAPPRSRQQAAPSPAAKSRESDTASGLASATSGGRRANGAAAGSQMKRKWASASSTTRAGSKASGWPPTSEPMTRWRSSRKASGEHAPGQPPFGTDQCQLIRGDQQRQDDRCFLEQAGGENECGERREARRGWPCSPVQIQEQRRQHKGGDRDFRERGNPEHGFAARRVGDKEQRTEEARRDFEGREEAAEKPVEQHAVRCVHGDRKHVKRPGVSAEGQLCEFHEQRLQGAVDRRNALSQRRVAEPPAGEGAHFALAAPRERRRASARYRCRQSEWQP